MQKHSMEASQELDGIGRILEQESSKGEESRCGRAVIWIVLERGHLVVVKRATPRYVRCGGEGLELNRHIATDPPAAPNRYLQTASTVD